MWPRNDYSILNYKSVSGSTTDTSGNLTVPDGVKVAITRIRSNSSGPRSETYVMIVWDYGGGDEKIFSSTLNDIDLKFDPSIPNYQITGNGVKKLSVVIVNDDSSESCVVGGSVELTKL